MSKTKTLKRKSDFSDAVTHSEALHDLPRYARRYLALDITHINWRNYSVYTGERYIEKKTGLNAEYRAKAYYFLVRKEVLIGTWDQPVKGGITPGRIYCPVVPVDNAPCAGEINQDIKALCGSLSRIKSPYILYTKALTHFNLSVDVFAGKRGRISGKALTHWEESVDALVPRDRTTGLTGLTDSSGLTGPAAKKDLKYLKALKHKASDDLLEEFEQKELIMDVTWSDPPWPNYDSQRAALLDDLVTVEAWRRAAIAFKRGQRKDGRKGERPKTEVGKYLKFVRLEHNRLRVGGKKG